MQMANFVFETPQRAHTCAKRRHLMCKTKQKTIGAGGNSKITGRLTLYALPHDGGGGGDEQNPLIKSIL